MSVVAEKHISANFGTVQANPEGEIVDVFGATLETVSSCSEPPPLNSLDLGSNLNESASSSVKSVRFPRSALKEIADPRATNGNLRKQTSPIGDTCSRSIPEATGNIPSKGAFDENKQDGTVGRDSIDFSSRPNQKLETVSKSAPRGSVDGSHLMRDGRRGSSDDHAKVTAAAVSAAMSAAIPYFRGQNDMEHQMKLLLEKVSRLERQEPPMDRGYFRESSAARVDRHLAELTEKRLLLLEKILEKEARLEMNSNYDMMSESPLSSGKVNPGKNFDPDIMARQKSVHYTKGFPDVKKAMQPQQSLSSKSKGKKFFNNLVSEFDDSLNPREKVPKPADATSELLKEILRGHNDSSLYTLDASGLENPHCKYVQTSLDNSTAHEAEAKILTELELLKEELLNLKFPVKVAKASHKGSQSKSQDVTEKLDDSYSSLSEDQLRIIRKRKSELLSQYFQEYSNPTPLKFERPKLSDISNTEIASDPSAVLDEARAYRKKYEFEKQIAYRNITQSHVHNRIDQLCHGISNDYYQLTKNVDKEISKIQTEIDRELLSVNFDQKDEDPVPVKPAKGVSRFGGSARQPKTALEKRVQTAVASSSRSIPASKDVTKKPVASVRPFGSRLANVKGQKKSEPEEDNVQVQQISPTQLAYQQLILQRQAEYREKLEQLQRVPAGSTVQSAGLLYNKNFYPIKGKVIGAAPETKEVATETKFQVDQHIQTEEKPLEEVKRVDLQSVRSKDRRNQLVIESLPSVEIEQVEVKKQVSEPIEGKKRDVKDLSDVIVVPGYGSNHIPQKSALRVSMSNEHRTYAQVQSCLEDEIMSHILRNVIGSATPNVPEVPRRIADSDDSISLSPENEEILQIFIDAGIPMDRRTLRQLGEDEVMKIILEILEDQQQKAVIKKLRTANTQPHRIPTPTPSLDDSQGSISPAVSKAERGVSPIHQPQELSDSEGFLDDLSRQTSRDQSTPRPHLATPERTPPRSPESSVVESTSSIAKEAPPSPEKTAPAKMPEPTISTVFDDVDMVDAGIQYEAPPSFRDIQIPPEMTPTSATESSTSESRTASTEATSGDQMSDHEWVLPHHRLKSEGEVTPPKVAQELRSFDLDTETGLESLAPSEGEVPRPRRKRSAHIKGPVTEALYEMRHLMAASNQGAHIIPRVERRRFKPFTPSSTNTPRGDRPKSPRTPRNSSRDPQFSPGMYRGYDTPVAQVTEPPKGPEVTPMGQMVNGSSDEVVDIASQIESPSVQKSEGSESVRTSSALKLPLADLTEATLSDDTEVLD